jgi:hypothetical protein
MQPIDKSFQKPNSDRHPRGSMLVFLIVLIVVFAVLGAGMVAMFGTSLLSVSSSNNARRAAYLAESGLRYVFSEVRNAAASAREAALTAIDDGSVSGKWFIVSPSVARYQVRVYPYWGKTAAGTGVATNSITVTIPNSGLPPGFAIPTAPGGSAVARLQVGPNAPFTINGATGATPGAKTVTYTLAAMVTIPAGITAYANLAFPTRYSIQTVTKDSAATPLALNINAVSAIPEKNGAFMEAASGKVYTYRTARLSGGYVQLEGITWNGGGATVTFPANSYLVFSQAARLDSTGEHQQTQRTQTDFVTLYSPTSSLGGAPQNYQPKDLTDAESGFSNTLTALDLSKSGNRVALQGYIATGGTHSYWAAFQHLGDSGYTFEDPEEAGRNIGWHVAPLASDIVDNLRNHWLQYHTLSYDAQVKMGWDLNQPASATGFAFRWHESPLFQGVTPPGSDPYRYYQGYGITYMIYWDDNHGSTDQVPNTIKPPGSSLNRRLLLVLWQQKVTAGGVPTKDWLAYATLGYPGAYYSPTLGERTPTADRDQKVTGYQVWPDGRLNDNAAIIVRVEDNFVTQGGVTTRCNDIKVFYGDASGYTFINDSRIQDSVATNKQRARYYPKWLELGAGGLLPAINPRWPSNRFSLSGSTIARWYNNLTSYDYFSLTSSAPTAPYNTVTWVTNTSPRAGFSAVDLLSDNSTIRTTDFALDSFPSGRKEIGLVATGNITPSGTVAFDDFYIQLLGGY